MITALAVKAGKAMVFALSGVVLIGCAATATNLKQTLLLHYVLAEPLVWQNKVVTIEGKFSGWNGQCKGAPPVSKSDWMLEDGNSCIYVNGRLPAGFSSLPPGTGTGRILVVQGVVRIDAKGLTYIENADVEAR